LSFPWVFLRLTKIEWARFRSVQGIAEVITVL
jgi:hypothetical protein